jgi:hypothetical protein
MTNGCGQSGRRGISHFRRGANKILLKRCYALYLNFSYAANSVSFLMPPVLRAWPKKFRLTWGADENFGLPTFVSEYKLTVEKRKREFLLCCIEMSILTFPNSALYCTPKLVATAAAFGRVGHYAVVIEHACDVLQISSQLVVRKLIGFCGNN